jgi:hypothetical protein
VLNIRVPLFYVRRTVGFAEILNGTGDGIGLGLSNLSDSDRRHGVCTKNVGWVWLHVRNSIIDRDHLRDDCVLKIHGLLRCVVESPSGSKYRIFYPVWRVVESETRRPVRHRHGIDRRVHLTKGSEGGYSFDEIESVDEILVCCPTGVGRRGSIPGERHVGCKVVGYLPGILDVRLSCGPAEVSSRHSNGLRTCQVSQEEVRKRTPCTGYRSKATAGRELCSEVAVEVEDTTSVCVGAGLNGSQIGDLRAKLDLMVSVQPIEAVVNLVDVIEITDEASRRAEAGEAREADARNAVRVGSAGDVLRFRRWFLQASPIG